MKLQPASKKEVIRIAKGSVILAVLLVLSMLLLSFVGVGTFSYRIVLSAAGGTAVAVLNFAMMCLMVQKADATQDEKLRRPRVQASYHLRLVLQAGWVVVAFLAPFLNVIAAAIPLFFPSATIYFLQVTGRLMPAGESPSPDRREDPKSGGEDPEEDTPGPFEV